VARQRGPFFAALVVSTSALVLSGCSWIFVTPPPADAGRGERVECTTSPAAPVVDTLLAASNVAGALYIAGTVGNKATPTQNALVTTGLVWAIVYTTAAVHGYRATAACRELVDGD
jgi:hypothetical protein